MTSSTSQTNLNSKAGIVKSGPSSRSDVPSVIQSENSAKALFRVDSGHTLSSSPHGPVERSPRPARAPTESPLSKELPSAIPCEDFVSPSNQSPASQPLERVPGPSDSTSRIDASNKLNQGAATHVNALVNENEFGETSSISWQTLHAENIAEILEKRLHEVERRELILNRRAAQLAMEERKFRLWAHEEKLLLRQQQREHVVRQEELNRRTSDLRWLLLMDDSSEPLLSHSSCNPRPNPADPNAPLTTDACSEFFENFCDNFEELFHEDTQGIRRLKSF